MLPRSSTAGGEVLSAGSSLFVTSIGQGPWLVGGSVFPALSGDGSQDGSSWTAAAVSSRGLKTVAARLPWRLGRLWVGFDLVDRVWPPCGEGTGSGGNWAADGVGGGANAGGSGGADVIGGAALMLQPGVRVRVWTLGYGPSLGPGLVVDLGLPLVPMQAETTAGTPPGGTIA